MNKLICFIAIFTVGELLVNPTLFHSCAGIFFSCLSRKHHPNCWDFLFQYLKAASNASLCSWL